MFAGFAELDCLQFPRRGGSELSEESWKWFQEAEMGMGGQWPAVEDERRLRSGFLRGVGLGALRAILTQINQTAAVGPGRPQGLRPPKCESEKPGSDSFHRRCVNSSDSEFLVGRMVGQSRESEIHSAAHAQQASQCNRRFFQLSPPSPVFCLKTLAFGNICWEK